MRLGELRTLTRDLDGRQVLKLSLYSEVYGVRVFDLELEQLNGDDELFFSICDEE